jgi:hypothetical protein
MIGISARAIGIKDQPIRRPALEKVSGSRSRPIATLAPQYVVANVLARPGVLRPGFETPG